MSLVPCTLGHHGEFSLPLPSLWWQPSILDVPCLKQCHSSLCLCCHTFSLSVPIFKDIFTSYNAICRIGLGPTLKPHHNLIHQQIGNFQITGTAMFPMQLGRKYYINKSEDGFLKTSERKVVPIFL